MRKSYFQPVLVAVLAVALAGLSLSARAEETKPEKPAPKHTQRPVPFSGTLSAVDKTAMTITVKKKEAEQTFEITSNTRIMKEGKPAVLSDGAVGDMVGGQYRKTDDGKLEAVSVRFGPKPEAAGTKNKKHKTEKVEPAAGQTNQVEKPTPPPGQ